VSLVHGHTRPVSSQPEPAKRPFQCVRDEDATNEIMSPENVPIVGDRGVRDSAFRFDP